MNIDREWNKYPHGGALLGSFWICAFITFLVLHGPVYRKKTLSCCCSAHFMSEMLGKYAGVEEGKFFFIQIAYISCVHAATMT